jgi:hypothetical protein
MWYSLGSDVEEKIGSNIAIIKDSPVKADIILNNDIYRGVDNIPYHSEVKVPVIGA